MAIFTYPILDSASRREPAKSSALTWTNEKVGYARRASKSPRRCACALFGMLAEVQVAHRHAQHFTVGFYRGFLQLRHGVAHCCPPVVSSWSYSATTGPVGVSRSGQLKESS